MDDVAENLRDERGEPDEPTREEVREWAAKHLRDGLEPDEDRDGNPMGPTFDGFEETLSEVRTMYLGAFTEDEFEEVARGAFEDALSAVREEGDADLDAETHRTLDGFEDAPSLTFDDDLVDALLDGRKNATVRYDLDADLSPGDPVRLRSDMRLRATEAFAQATVGDVIRTELSDALDAVDDEGYQHNAETVADLWGSLNTYYDDLGLSTEVAVVLLDDVEAVRV